MAVAGTLDLSRIFLWLGIALVMLISVGIIYYIIKKRREVRNITPDIYGDWRKPPEQQIGNIPALPEELYSQEQILQRQRLSEEALKEYYPQGSVNASMIKDIVTEVLLAMNKVEEEKEFLENPNLDKFLEKKILLDILHEATDIQYEFVKDVQVLGATVKVTVSGKKPETITRPQPDKKIESEENPDYPSLPPQKTKKDKNKIKREVVETLVEEEEQEEYMEDDEEDSAEEDEPEEVEIIK